MLYLGDNPIFRSNENLIVFFKYRDFWCYDTNSPKKQIQKHVQKSHAYHSPYEQESQEIGFKNRKSNKTEITKHYNIGY
jgi:hypothetical protein